MTIKLSCLALALALTAAVAAPAAAQSGTQGKPAAKPMRAAAKPGAPIICTKYGCKPLPANCHAETEFTWEGPTGYQIIVCP